MRGSQLLLLIAVLLVAPASGALEGGVLRVGTSGDYAPFSLISGDDPVVFEGFDVSVARAYAEERGLALLLERFRWPHLIDDLEADRFDLAMSGVTIAPERSDHPWCRDPWSARDSHPMAGDCCMRAPPIPARMGARSTCSISSDAPTRG